MPTKVECNRQDGSVVQAAYIIKQQALSLSLFWNIAQLTGAACCDSGFVFVKGKRLFKFGALFDLRVSVI